LRHNKKASHPEDELVRFWKNDGLIRLSADDDMPSGAQQQQGQDGVQAIPQVFPDG
jgi:hypothetical protein